MTGTPIQPWCLRRVLAWRPVWLDGLGWVPSGARLPSHLCGVCRGGLRFPQGWAVGKQGWETVSDRVSVPSLRLSGRVNPIHDIGGNFVRFPIPRVLTPESE